MLDQSAARRPGGIVPARVVMYFISGSAGATEVSRMNRRLLPAAIMFIAAASWSLAAPQDRTPPPGASDKSLSGDVMPGVKGRSNELERVKRDTEKPEKKNNAEETFPQIKEDFEQIQLVNSNVL